MFRIMRKPMTLSVATLCFCLAAAAWAENSASGAEGFRGAIAAPRRATRARVRPVAVMGVAPRRFGYYHASTAGEGYARGVADVIRSRGMANYLNSKAAINFMQARSMYLDNRSKTASTYFSMRETNRAARAAERPPMPTAEQLSRYARSARPKPVGLDQLNPSDGGITWPHALRTDTFATSRDGIQRVFTRRAVSGDSMSVEDYTKAQSVLKEMRENLHKRLGDYSPQDYMAAKRFLGSLAYELRFQSNDFGASAFGSTAAITGSPFPAR